MERPIFIPQETLDKWSAEGKVHLDGHTLEIPSQKRTYQLKPAVRFVKEDSATGDPHKLLGRVKTHEQLKAMGGEQYMTSVILQDSAYQVQEGFLGTIDDGRPATGSSTSIPAIGATRSSPAIPAAPAASAPAAAPAAKPAENLTDAELLAKFLLEKM